MANRIDIDIEDLPEVDDKRIVIELDDLPPDDPPAQQKVYPIINTGQRLPEVKKGKGSFVGANWVQNLLAGLVGGFLGWLIQEPFYDDFAILQTVMEAIMETCLFAGVIGASIGCLLGAAEGIAGRVWPKALRDGGIGLAFGLGAGIVGGGIGQIIYSLLGGGTGGISIAAQVFARALAWTIIGLMVGLGQGISYKSSKKIINGLLGGALGGFIGGVLFDVIAGATGGGVVSRMLAITLMGGCTGCAIGLVDELRKEAWLKVISGFLAGKEYILFNDVTTIGSSPKCSIVLYKDANVAPIQAVIRLQSGSYFITDSNPNSGTYIGDTQVSNARLFSGHTIRIGSTMFSFTLKEVQQIG